MLADLREAVIASVRRRVAQGDCPIERAHTIETLEHVIMDLTTPAPDSEKLREALEPCKYCGGNGFSGGVIPKEPELCDACEVCLGRGKRPSSTQAAERVEDELTKLFPEWDADQREAIASILSGAALGASA